MTGKRHRLVEKWTATSRCTGANEGIVSLGECSAASSPPKPFTYISSRGESSAVEFDTSAYRVSNGPDRAFDLSVHITVGDGSLTLVDKGSDWSSQESTSANNAREFPVSGLPDERTLTHEKPRSSISSVSEDSLHVPEAPEEVQPSHIRRLPPRTTAPRSSPMQATSSRNPTTTRRKRPSSSSSSSSHSHSPTTTKHDLLQTKDTVLLKSKTGKIFARAANYEAWPDAEKEHIRHQLFDMGVQAGEPLRAVHNTWRASRGLGPVNKTTMTSKVSKDFGPQRDEMRRSKLVPVCVSRPYHWPRNQRESKQVAGEVRRREQEGVPREGGEAYLARFAREVEDEEMVEVERDEGDEDDGGDGGDDDDGDGDAVYVPDPVEDSEDHPADTPSTAKGKRRAGASKSPGLTGKGGKGS